MMLPDLLTGVSSSALRPCVPNLRDLKVIATGLVAMLSRMAIRRSITIRAVSALTASIAISTATLAPANASFMAAPRGQLVWADEFNGSAGASIDPANWGFDIGHERGWGNDELEYYTNSNASLDGRGNLVITATPDGADRYQCS